MTLYLGVKSHVLWSGFPPSAEVQKESETPDVHGWLAKKHDNGKGREPRTVRARNIVGLRQRPKRSQADAVVAEVKQAATSPGGKPRRHIKCVSNIHMA